MFKNNDQEFAEIAADPVRRRAAIADLAGRGKTMLFCAGGASGALIMATIANPQGTGVLAGCVAGLWAIAFKFDSDLRLLRVVERLHGESGRPATSVAHEQSQGTP
ncbi:MAG: hypothetical protein DWI05_05640 [Planctomycetota bacterium]|nr:MAG: hypothetical protein DWI05_05640 [Planctomycetota bacterium]